MSNTFHRLLLKNKRNLSISLIFVCAFYITAVLFADPEKIYAAFSRMNRLDWLLVLSCSFSNYILRFIRWHYYLRYLSHSISIFQNFLYYMTGFALTLTPAKIGETIRSTYLAQHAVPYTHSLAMFFSERFLDVVVIALLSLFSLQDSLENGSPHIRSFTIISVIVLVSFIPFLRQSFVTHFILLLSSKVKWHRLQSFLKYFVHLLNTARELFAFKPVTTGLFLGTVAWLIQGLAFYFILTTLSIDISLQQSIGIYAISLLAGGLSFIPGGIGTTEAVMVLLLTLLGADTATAIATALISRLSTLWFAVGLGLSTALFLSLREDH